MSVGQAVGRVAGYLGIALQEQRPVRSNLPRRGARPSAGGHSGGGGHPPIRQWPNQSVGCRISRALPIMGAVWGHQGAPAPPSYSFNHPLIWALGKIIGMDKDGIKVDMRAEYKHELSPDRQAGDIDRQGRGWVRIYRGRGRCGWVDPLQLAAVISTDRMAARSPKGTLPASTQMSSKAQSASYNIHLLLLQPAALLLY